MVEEDGVCGVGAAKKLAGGGAFGGGVWVYYLYMRPPLNLPQRGRLAP